MPVDADTLLRDKRIARVALWFVTPACELARIEWHEGEPLPDLPADGFLFGVAAHACDGQLVNAGTEAAPRMQRETSRENLGGDGWLVMGMTKHGLLCQVTGGDAPDPARYPGCQFSRCQLAPSALLHVASEEMRQWR